MRGSQTAGKLLTDADIADMASEVRGKNLNEIRCDILPNKGNTSNIQHDHLFKLIVIGDSGVGKSCLMHRVTSNEFMEDHEVTVGVEFGTLSMQIEDIKIKLQIWDTAGQENF